MARIPAWRGRPVTVRALPGGLTNANYRVDVGNRAYVVRLPGADTTLLGIDREQEHQSTRLAAQRGVGARLVHWFPDCQVMVLEFIHGRTMTATDLRQPGMPARIATTLKRLHGGPRLRRDFDMLGLAAHYLDLAGRRAVPVPAGLKDRWPLLRRVGRALAAVPLPRVPCHNDLLPENFIDDGHTLRIIDYEYSGNNDPAFELGDLCVELEYDDDLVGAVCAAYFGELSTHQVARVKLNRIVSDVGWSLWAAIQATISHIAFDFDGYGQRRWARAQADLDGPSVSRWLDDARRPA